MRIVSLHPAATEWIAASGGADRIVGRSHRCSTDGLAHAQVVTSELRAEAPSAAEDADPFLVETRSIRPDIDAVLRLSPDLIITGDPLLNIAPTPHPGSAAIHVFAPTSFKEILDGALKLGVMCGASTGTMRLLAGLERELLIARKSAGLDKRHTTAKRVTLVHGRRRLLAGGYWLDDLIELAGGRPLLHDGAGRPPRPISVDDIMAAGPDFLLDASSSLVPAEVCRDSVSVCVPLDFPLYRPSPELYGLVPLLIHALSAAGTS